MLRPDLNSARLPVAQLGHGVKGQIHGAGRRLVQTTDCQMPKAGPEILASLGAEQSRITLVQMGVKAEIQNRLSDFKLNFVVQLGLCLKPFQPGRHQSFAGNGIKAVRQKGIETCAGVNIGAAQQQNHEFRGGQGAVAHAFPRFAPYPRGDQVAVQRACQRVRQYADYLRRIPVRHHTQNGPLSEQV